MLKVKTGNIFVNSICGMVQYDNDNGWKCISKIVNSYIMKNFYI